MTPAGGGTPNLSDAEEESHQHILNNSVLRHSLNESVRTKSCERRCPSLACNRLISDHDFGVPSRLCPGNSTSLQQPTSSTKSLKPKRGPAQKKNPPATSRLVPDEQLQRLQAELDSLSNQEQQLLSYLQSEEVNLKKQIEEKKSSLASLEALLTNQQHAVSGTRTNQPIRSTLTADHIPDFLVASSERIPPPQQQSLQQIYKQQEERSTEVFLRPTRSVVTSCGKPLRIVDFISRLTPNQEDRLLSTDKVILGN